MTLVFNVSALAFLDEAPAALFVFDLDLVMKHASPKLGAVPARMSRPPSKIPTIDSLFGGLPVYDSNNGINGLEND